MGDVVAEAMADELWERNCDLLRTLKVGRRWVRATAARFNGWIASGEAGKPYASVGAWNQLFEHLVWDYEGVTDFTPSLLELCSYSQALPEIAHPGGWRGFARRLTSDDPSSFRSALAELALHRRLAAAPGLTVEFNFGLPDRPRCDYTLRFQGRTLHAELKSILPEIRDQENAARLIQRVYFEAFAKKQVAPDGNSMVFVDVSGWPALALKLFIDQLTQQHSPERLSLPTVADRCRLDRQVGIEIAPLFIVLLEPCAARVAHLLPVDPPLSAAAA
jgi:hypothetical protein